MVEEGEMAESIDSLLELEAGFELERRVSPVPRKAALVEQQEVVIEQPVAVE